MILIVDTNTLISALLKDALTRKIMTSTNWQFHYPEEAFQELRKYKSLILEKADVSEEEYTNLPASLLKYIIIMPKEQYAQALEEAEKTMQDRDPDDIIFLACALNTANAKVWSNDNDFEQQQKVMVFKTAELAKIAGLI